MEPGRWRTLRPENRPFRSGVSKRVQRSATYLQRALNTADRAPGAQRRSPSALSCHPLNRTPRGFAQQMARSARTYASFRAPLKFRAPDAEKVRVESDGPRPAVVISRRTGREQVGCGRVERPSKLLCLRVLAHPPRFIGTMCCRASVRSELTALLVSAPFRPGLLRQQPPDHASKHLTTGQLGAWRPSIPPQKAVQAARSQGDFGGCLRIWLSEISTPEQGSEPSVGCLTIVQCFAGLRPIRRPTTARVRHCFEDDGVINRAALKTVPPRLATCQPADRTPSPLSEISRRAPGDSDRSFASNGEGQMVSLVQASNVQPLAVVAFSASGQNLQVLRSGSGAGRQCLLRAAVSSPGVLACVRL